MRVKGAIALASGPIILAGPSYGGAVISEAGNDPKVEALVYIAAFAPDAGESAGSLGASVEPAPLSAEIRPDGEGYLKLTQSGVSDSFAQDLNDTEKLVLYAAQSPTAGAALGPRCPRRHGAARLVAILSQRTTAPSSPPCSGAWPSASTRQLFRLTPTF